MTRHTCSGPMFGRLTPGCPRCEELRAGAPARVWSLSNRRAQAGRFLRAVKSSDLDRETLAWAAATDAGNRSMRKAGRTAWNAEDFNAAVSELDRLRPIEAPRPVPVDVLRPEQFDTYE